MQKIETEALDPVELRGLVVEAIEGVWPPGRLERRRGRLVRPRKLAPGGVP